MRNPKNSAYGKAPLVLALALALGGCALKSPPSPADLRAQTLPAAAVPESWKAGAPSGTFAAGWLASFQDPQLLALVDEALRNNPDLKVAAARIEQANATVAAVSGGLWPSVAAYGRAGGKVSDGSGLTGAALTVNWELDLWGRVRSEQAAARAQYSATEADYAWARQTIAASVARAWFLASEARQQRQLAEQSVSATEKLLALEETRKRVGNADDSAVSNIREALVARRDAVAQLKLTESQSLRAIELLVGRYPAAEIEAPSRLTELPPDIPAGLPSQLLERRPDVIAAERRVASSFYRTEESKAARLPAIKLTAGANSIDSSLFVLQDRNNPVWSFGAGLLVPIFTGGTLQAQVDVRTAEQKAAVASYASTGQRAFADVENALASNIALTARKSLAERKLRENQRQVQLAQTRLKVGAGDMRAVINEELGLLGAQGELLRLQSEALVQRVNLHLALGGDFASPTTTTSTP